MSVVHFFSTRTSVSSVSTSRAITANSARSSSSRRHQSSNSAFVANNKSSAPVQRRRQNWGADAHARCLSTVANQKQHKLQQKYSGGEQQHDSSFTRKVLAGLSTAGVAAVGASTLDNERDEKLSLCEPQSSVEQPSFYHNFGDNLKAFFWFDENTDHNKPSAPAVAADGLYYEPSSTASTMPGRMIGVVKAATEWEKKAKETVKMMTYPYPKNYDISVRALKGGRLSMEDKYAVEQGTFKFKDFVFAGVFDGHGGGCVSTYLSETLFDKISRHLKNKDEEDSTDNRSLDFLAKKIRAAFREVNEDVLNNNEFEYQGSTAVAVWVDEDEEKGRTIVSANVGDSRAVLSHQGQAIELTRDHKPNDELEKERILEMGYEIEWDPYCNVHRVQNLSLSRAIGDKFAKPAISSEVDISMYPLKESGDNDFVILASDGLWDVMSSKECVDYINDRLNPPRAQVNTMSALEVQRQTFAKRKNMGRFVANEALKRGSSDNICVVIVWLNKSRAS
mmetsp:Transcript_13762/g.20889  ORF Transcript_13762/g.20889 Transcript_13762/m.20889 type:complete len:507 (-) Transcript_13762:15-1535(-)